MTPKMVLIGEPPFVFIMWGNYMDSNNSILH